MENGALTDAWAADMPGCRRKTGILCPLGAACCGFDFRQTGEHPLQGKHVQTA